MRMDDLNKYPGEFVVAAATFGKLSIDTLRGYAALGGLLDQTGHLKLKIREVIAGSPQHVEACQGMAMRKGRNMRFQRTVLIPTALAAGLAMQVPAHADTSQEAAFLAENQAAMDKMMAGMNIKPTSDVDHDFTAMMIPHHQGAIEMAQAELRYGDNEQLHRIAQEIVVEQMQEIAAMRLAVGEPASPTWVRNSAHDSPAPSSTGGDASFVIRSNAAMDKMMTNMAVMPTGDVDHDFVAMMVPHHQGAIDMAQAELQYGRDPQLQTIAQEIVADQTQEITLMRLALR